MTSVTVHSVRAWYLRYRTRGRKPTDALRYARIHHKAESDIAEALTSVTHASLLRAQSFVDDFIRGPQVDTLTSERDSDWINEPERAERCYDAAEEGADGKTHAEVIEDWRDAFSAFMSNRRGHGEYERFEALVRAQFNACEMWHEWEGGLHNEIV